MYSYLNIRFLFALISNIDIMQHTHSHTSTALDCATCGFFVFLFCSFHSDELSLFHSPSAILVAPKLIMLLTIKYEPYHTTFLISKVLRFLDRKEF